MDGASLCAAKGGTGAVGSYSDAGKTGNGLKSFLRKEMGTHLGDLAACPCAVAPVGLALIAFLKVPAGLGPR